VVEPSNGNQVIGAVARASLFHPGEPGKK
jgi:hypothetical protein